MAGRHPVLLPARGPEDGGESGSTGVALWPKLCSFAHFTKYFVKYECWKGSPNDISNVRHLIPCWSGTSHHKKLDASGPAGVRDPGPRGFVHMKCRLADTETLHTASQISAMHGDALHCMASPRCICVKCALSVLQPGIVSAL